MSKRFSVEQLSSTVSEARTNFTSDKRLGQSWFSVEQLSSTISEACTNLTSNKRLGQSFYNRGTFGDTTYIWVGSYGNAGKGGCLRVIRTIGIEIEKQDPFREQSKPVCLKSRGKKSGPNT